MKKWGLILIIVFIAAFLYGEEKVETEIVKKKFNFTFYKNVALGMSVGGGGGVIIGSGLIIAGAFLINYFMQNATITSKDSFGMPYEYYWNKDSVSNANELYYYPGIVLTITGGIFTIMSLASIFGSIYFWLNEPIKKDKEKKVGLFIDIGLESKMGFFISL